MHAQSAQNPTLSTKVTYSQIAFTSSGLWLSGLIGLPKQLVQVSWDRTGHVAGTDGWACKGSARRVAFRCAAGAGSAIRRRSSATARQVLASALCMSHDLPSIYLSSLIVTVDFAASFLACIVLKALCV